MSLGKKPDPKRSGLVIPGPDWTGLRLAVGASVELVTRGNTPCLDFSDPHEVGKAYKQSPEVSGCLDPFIRLQNANDEEIRDYAGLWGRLGVCWHQIPYRHHHLCPSLEAPGPRSFTPSEPVDTWRFYARKFRATLKVGTDLREGRLPRLEDWQLMHEWPDPLTDQQLVEVTGELEAPRVFRVDDRFRPSLPPTPRLWSLEQLGPATIDRNLEELAKSVNGWIALSGLQPVVGLVPALGQRARLAASHSIESLLQALIAQLTDELAHHGLYECSNCHYPFFSKTRQRQPTPNRARYCDECRRNKHAAVKKRKAKERYWASKEQPIASKQVP